MLTRLKISGFKSLFDVDVRFGPFTCIAGANGSGKSNFFDAIQFLSFLADGTLIESAHSVRDHKNKETGIHTLFHVKSNDTISFEADMITPKSATDDLGQKAEAISTFLTYKLVLKYAKDDENPKPLKIVKEELTRANKSKHLKFPHRAPAWEESVYFASKRMVPFISTTTDKNQFVIKLHQDGGSRGRPQKILAEFLPRTVLSTVDAANPTALAARREMQSWRLLQLEPSKLREPDRFHAEPAIQLDGSGLSRTLYHQAHFQNKGNPDRIYESVSQRMRELIDDITSVKVDKDETRQRYHIMAVNRDGETLPARSLSDGTLRFLALSTIEIDPDAEGVICLEEPENGIHPKRIPAILRLLQDIAVDAELKVDRDNPLRQVIVNTHSPVVVAQIPEDTLLVASLKKNIEGGKPFYHTHFNWLSDTWRSEIDPDTRALSLGDLIQLLDPVPADDECDEPKKKSKRTIDRSDVQLSLFG